MAGHGPAGAIARGTWTRLFVHAIYLEDAAGHSLVLVSCDLWAMPAGLSDRVAELVGTAADARHIGRRQIVLAATHTHHGPGNFSSSKIYNGSASPRFGFDQELFEFLAHRIAAAIMAAADNARPATVRLHETRVPGLMRNRSLAAFMLDPREERTAILEANGDLPPGEARENYPTDAYRAVDPRLTVLTMESTSDPPQTIGVAAFVAVHPTAMRNVTAVYNSDLFGVAATVVEHALQADTHPAASPVVAIFNGAEGDISPDWARQDRRDALRLGQTLGRCIVKLSTRREAVATCQVSKVDLPVAGAIDYRFTIARLAHGCFKEKPEIDRCTADHPLPGVAMLGGAEDGRTFLYELGWQEGVTGPHHYPNQGSKQGALDLPVDPRSLSALLAPLFEDLTERKVKPSDVPQWIPLGVYRLGPVAIATLPGEFTTVMGRRIAAAIKKAMKPAPARVILIGLANEYVSYFTTPEEYEAQHYEGASTLYGPASGPLVKHDLLTLVDQFAKDPPKDTPRDFRYWPGDKTDPRDIGNPPYFVDDGLANVLQDLRTGDPIRDFPRYCWTDEVPLLPAAYERSVRITPQVAMEQRDGEGHWVPLLIGGIEESDQGLDFITVMVKDGDETSQWCAFWMPPAEADRSMTLRFRVDTMRGPRIWSPPFQVQD